MSLGLSLSSSWGNGHATTYRALAERARGRGHDILFLERDQPWYAAHRDLARPGFLPPGFLRRSRAIWIAGASAIAHADAVIVGSYVPDGVAVAAARAGDARGVTAFYDIDTPVTLAKLDAGDERISRGRS